MMLRWNDSGPSDKINVYGKHFYNGYPVICGHGGSMWFCHTCAKSYEETLEREKIEETWEWDNLA